MSTAAAVERVAPAMYGGWTISGRIEAEGGAFIALPVLFGSEDPKRPRAEVRVRGWEGETVSLDVADLVGSVRSEGYRQWRGILNGF